MNENSSSVWIQCRQCEHTSRALSVMVNRILADRRKCPRCASLVPPLLHQTFSGSNIMLTEVDCAAMRRAESKTAVNHVEDLYPTILERMRRMLAHLGVARA